MTEHYVPIEQHGISIVMLVFVLTINKCSELLVILTREDITWYLTSILTFCAIIYYISNTFINWKKHRKSSKKEKEGSDDDDMD